MKIKAKTDKFGVTTITCKAKARESFDSFAASSFSLGKKWFLSFKYEAKKKGTVLQFSSNNLISLEDFLSFALLRDQFAGLLLSLSNFLTYTREHDVQNEYVLYDTKYVLIDKESLQLKFVYLPFKTPEEAPNSLYDFLIDVGQKIKLANDAQDAEFLKNYNDFFVLRELFSVTKFKDMIDSILKCMNVSAEEEEHLEPKTNDLRQDSYEALGAKKDVFVESVVKPTESHEEEVSQTLVSLVWQSTNEKFVCEKLPCVVGAGDMADLRIPGCSAISRRHAQIDEADGAFTITDLNSTNGTYVNNKRIVPGEPEIVNQGDVIKLANENFTFEINSSKS